MNQNQLTATDKRILFLLAVLVLTAMLLVKPETIPQPGFDEGWTISVAKNWVEQGKYALQQNGDWVSAAPMAQPFSVTALVALCIRLFGVGVLQGRLAVILLTIPCMGLLFAHAMLMFGKTTAWVTLFVLLFLAPFSDLNPMIFGRQAIGEIPMLLYLLSGYWFWIRTLKGARHNLVWASIFWGLALLTKRQTLPFWFFSLCVVLFLSAIRKERQVFLISLSAIVGTGLCFILLQLVEKSFLGDFPLNGHPIQGLYSLAAWTFKTHIRIGVLKELPLLSGTTLIGLLASIRVVRDKVERESKLSPEEWLIVSFYALASSWFFWFVFGSLGWWRYYFPAFVLSAPFCARFLIGVFYMIKSNKATAPSIPFWRKVKALTTAAAAFYIVLIGFGLSATSFFAVNIPTSGREVQAVVDFIHEYTQETDMIETYESQLFIYLDRTYHYPPDQIQIDLNRRTILLENNRISYNPLDFDPDYIVEGPVTRNWGLYRELVDSETFSIVKEFPNYTIYKYIQ